MSRWNFQVPRSAKPDLQALAEKMIDIGLVPQTVNLLVTQINVKDYLAKKMSELPEARAQQAREEIKKLVATWQ